MFLYWPLGVWVWINYRFRYRFLSLSLLNEYFSLGLLLLSDHLSLDPCDTGDKGILRSTRVFPLYFVGLCDFWGFQCQHCLWGSQVLEADVASGVPSTSVTSGRAVGF